MSGLSRVKNLENRIAILFGVESMAMKAFNLIGEMSAKNGYTRYDGSDYFLHPIEVCTTIVNFGIRDEITVVAALLHDFIEDVVGYTRKMIAVLFCEEVAEIVDLCSKKKGLDYKTPDVLWNYLNKIAENPRAAIVKAADRMHNITTICDAKLPKRYEKAVQTTEYYIPFFRHCRDSYPRYSAFFVAAKIHVESHLWEIKEHYNDVTTLEETISKLKEQVRQLKEGGEQSYAVE